MSTIQEAPIPTRDGIFPMEAEAYHADKSAWSNSMLKDFRRRKSACYERHILGTAPEFETTPAMRLGTATHAALLEPDRMDDLFAIYPDSILSSNGAASTKEAKAFRAVQEQFGRLVMKASEMDSVRAMVASVSAKIGQWLTHDAKIEHAIYWTDEETGVRCKCRPDFLCVKPGFALTLDLKTTSDCSPDEFRRKVETMSYWLQDAHYSAGIKAATGADPMFLFVAVENEWPFDCAAYQIRESDRVAASMVRRETLMQIGQAQKSGNWQDAWLTEVTQLTLKPWVLG